MAASVTATIISNAGSREKHYTHGTLGLADAIKVSCDSFFYQYGNAAGIQSIDDIGKMMGIGEESGLQLSGEQTGNMPGPEWMQIHHPQERWSQAQTANVSIGQGYTLVSPLAIGDGLRGHRKWRHMLLPALG